MFCVCLPSDPLFALQSDEKFLSQHGSHHMAACNKLPGAEELISMKTEPTGVPDSNPNIHINGNTLLPHPHHGRPTSGFEDRSSSSSYVAGLDVRCRRYKLCRCMCRYVVLARNMT